MFASILMALWLWRMLDGLWLQLPAVYIGDNFEMFRPIVYFEKRYQHLKTVIAITVNCHQDIVSTRII